MQEVFYPDASWHIVTLYLDPYSIANLSQLNNQLHLVCQRESLWCVMMCKIFLDHITLQEVQGQYMKWYRDLYQYGAYYTSNVLHIRTITPPIGYSYLLETGQYDCYT